MEVLACEADIVWQDAQLMLSDVSRLWGDAPFSYDIEGVINAFRQEPACGYELIYNIKYEDVFNAPGLRTASPIEVQYSPYTFTIDKCSEASQLANPGSDNDCDGIPFNQLFRVYIETELRNEPRGAMNDLVSFEVSIGNYCELDEISFDPATLISAMTYTIRTPAEYFKQDLII